MTASRLSERIAIAAAIGIALLHFFPAAGSVLQYERAHLFDQPWRALTAHWVHINWPHALINAAALVVVARLFAEDLTARRQMIVVIASGLAIGLGLAALWPSIVWYRGLSGTVHALYFAGSLVWLTRACAATRRTRFAGIALALFAGGWVKVLAEQTAAQALPVAQWLGAPVVPQAHLIGAVCGTALGLAFAIADTHRRPTRAAS